jgi:hypothetical protein
MNKIANKDRLDLLVQVISGDITYLHFMTDEHAKDYLECVHFIN